MTELTLNVTRTINATAKTLFNAWLDPKIMANFMAPGPDMTVPSVNTDPVEGGRFELIMQAGDQQIPHAGTYKEITRHSRLIFTWESPFFVDDSTVTLTFTPVKDGTRIDLHHVRFADEETRANHEGGWTAILGKLETAIK